MPRRALIQRRPYLLASMAAAIAFYLLRDGHLPEPVLIALKGAGVALLAVYALRQLPTRDGKTIAAVMAFGALGDMAIEWDVTAGAALFLFGHLIAIWFYMRHRRERLAFSQKLAALALLLMVPLLAWHLPADRASAPTTALYALALSGMAAAAWTSSFPRYRVGIGALLFVASDLLIFARLGAWRDHWLPDTLVWPLYYIGQLMITVGVVTTLRQRGNDVITDV